MVEFLDIQFFRRLSFHGESTCEELGVRQRERVLINVAGVLTTVLLRSGEIGCEDPTGQGPHQVPGRAQDAEITDLRTVADQQDVLRLDVAMLPRLRVQVGDRLARLGDVPDDAFCGIPWLPGLAGAWSAPR